MRRLILAVLLTAAAGLALAQEPRPPAQDPLKPAQKTIDSKEFTVTVVSTDPTVKTITVKKDTPGATGAMAEQVLSVDDKALANLKTTKAGDKVTIMLKADPATGKEIVTSIEKPKSSTQEPR